MSILKILMPYNNATPVCFARIVGHRIGNRLTTTRIKSEMCAIIKLYIGISIGILTAYVEK